jgi:hypothetical protein
MKKQIMFKLIVLSLILIIGGCKDKVLNPITNNPISDGRITIKEFSIENGVKALIEESNSGGENKLILTLPSNYPLDYVTPNIVVSESTKEITPKSGERVLFEGQQPIYYKLLDKEGNYQNFFLYVRRTEKLEVKTITKEWIFDKIDQMGYVKLQIEATLGKMGTYNGGTYLVFLDKFGNKVNQLGGYQSLDVTSTIYNNNSNYNGTNPFPKAGEYKIKISDGYRESDLFPFSIKNGDVALIPKAYLYPRFIRNQKVSIQGFNFMSKNKYSIIFKNDFIDSPIKVPLEFIDENTLSIFIPSSFEDNDYDVDFFENDIVIDSKIPDGIAVRTDDFNQYNIKIFQGSNNGAVTNLLPQDFYLKGEEINSFIICCGGQLKGSQYELKLVNTDSKKVYKLAGEKKSLGASGNSWVSFTITDNVPKGNYEVYGIMDGNESLRYRKKIEIK